MNVIYNGPNNEHLFSLQCEDSAIGIDNPEVMNIFTDWDGPHIMTAKGEIEHGPFKPGDTFPLPDSIGYEIVQHCGKYGLMATTCYNCAGSCSDPKYIARLKLKSIPEKEEQTPIWYTKSEIHNWLILQNYSPLIADELSKKWADDLQGAFNKGFEKGSQQQLSEFNYSGFKKVWTDYVEPLQKELLELKADNERIQNDLLDALDLKAGNGPTALSMVVKERDALKAELSEAKELLVAVHSDLKSQGMISWISMLYSKIESFLSKSKID